MNGDVDVVQAGDLNLLASGRGLFEHLFLIAHSGTSARLGPICTAEGRLGLTIAILAATCAQA